MATRLTMFSALYKNLQCYCIRSVQAHMYCPFGAGLCAFAILFTYCQATWTWVCTKNSSTKKKWMKRNENILCRKCKFVSVCVFVPVIFDKSSSKQRQNKTNCISNERANCSFSMHFLFFPFLSFPFQYLHFWPCSSLLAKKFQFFCLMFILPKHFFICATELMEWSLIVTKSIDVL